MPVLSPKPDSILFFGTITGLVSFGKPSS